MNHGAQSLSAASLAIAGGVSADATPGDEQPENEQLEKAFEALATFDWGTGITIPEPGKPPEDSRVLEPIDEAVIAARGDAAAAQALEQRLAAVLESDAPRAAKDYVCRTLKALGTAASVPPLAALLLDPELSHMARFALESNAAPEAADALREGLPQMERAQKIGTMGSLGKRRDAASAPALVTLLADDDAAVSTAAATALGEIGTPAAAEALCACLKQASDTMRAAATDACLICAERLLQDGHKAEAIAVYKSLGGDNQTRHVRLAVTRGLLLAAGKKE